MRDRRLPRQGPALDAWPPATLLAVRSSGAYGFTMSSNYNSRPRAAEVMVDGDQAHVVRQRETLEIAVGRGNAAAMKPVE